MSTMSTMLEIRTDYHEVYMELGLVFAFIIVGILMVCKEMKSQ